MTHLLSDGGYEFMIPLLLLLIIVLLLIVRGVIKNSEKNLSILKSISLFALVFGFLGFTIGLISALDTIANVSDIAPEIIAGGFKIGILPPTFGMIVFLVGRAGVTVLIGLKKE
jgi:vacuolar-type H+-ATPase subunit I/STV1